MTITPKYFARKLILITCLFQFSACSTIGYYTQSVSGQLSLLYKREDIHDVINDGNTPDSLKYSLQQAIEIRQFASEKLKLPDNKSYMYYADLDRPYVVWNVFAAPEFSLEPKSWCYFIVGCVSYRGYFAEEDAIETANTLKQEHFDVHVAGISAYSTLGWFDDPLLNTMVHWRTRSLASLLFHELSHQVIYISNETAFNEAFSTAVERLGTIQWLLSHHPEMLDNYLDFLHVQQDFRQLLLNTRGELETLYQSSLDNKTKRKNKSEIIQQLKQSYENKKREWPSDIHFDKWFEKPINNARLTASMTYLQKVPAFFRIYMDQEADWEQFFKTIIKMDDMKKNERDELIERKIMAAPSIEELVNLIKQKHISSSLNDA